MERDKSVDIWFVFRILSELRQFYLCNLYLCAGMLEILHLQLIYKFGWASYMC